MYVTAGFPREQHHSTLSPLLQQLLDTLKQSTARIPPSVVAVANSNNSYNSKMDTLCRAPRASRATWYLYCISWGKQQQVICHHTGPNSNPQRSLMSRLSPVRFIVTVRQQLVVVLEVT